MNLKVQREFLTSKSTIGRMFLLGSGGQSDFQCYTLEPEQRTDDVKPRAIPSGTYVLTLRFSQHHGRIIPHVEGVPGFDAIEIHIGNKPEDTLACTCVGKTRDTDFIGQSHAAFDALFDKMLAAASPSHDGVQHVGYITYVDPGKQ
jgi:hypothetical protein